MSTDFSYKNANCDNANGNIISKIIYKCSYYSTNKSDTL